MVVMGVGVLASLLGSVMASIAGMRGVISPFYFAVILLVISSFHSGCKRKPVDEFPSSRVPARIVFRGTGSNSSDSLVLTFSYDAPRSQLSEIGVGRYIAARGGSGSAERREWKYILTPQGETIGVEVRGDEAECLFPVFDWQSISGSLFPSVSGSGAYLGYGSTGSLRNRIILYKERASVRRLDYDRNQYFGYDDGGDLKTIVEVCTAADGTAMRYQWSRMQDPGMHHAFMNVPLLNLLPVERLGYGAPVHVYDALRTFYRLEGKGGAQDTIFAGRTEVSGETDGWKARVSVRNATYDEFSFLKSFDWSWYRGSELVQERVKIEYTDN